MKEKIVKLPNAAIDRKAWDACVSTGEPFLPDAFSWLLDEVSPGWEGIVLFGEAGAYSAVLPVPLLSRFGLSFIRQSPFSFILGISAGKKVTAAEKQAMVRRLLNSRRFISDYKMYEEIKPAAEKELAVRKGNNFIIDLGRPHAEIREQYSKNRKRDLQKASKNHLALEKTSSLNQFYELFRKYTQRKVYNLTDEIIDQSRTVFQLCQQKGMLEVFTIYSEKECVGSAVFLVHKRGIYYLMASYSDAGQTLGASTALMDGVIGAYAGGVPFLSFNGSKEAGLVRFYSSFGARPRSFSILRQLRLPYPVRKLIAWRSEFFKAMLRG